MKQGFILALTLLFTPILWADTLPFELTIEGEHFSVQKSLELSDVGEGKTNIVFDFNDDGGKQYSFSLNYKALPSNRSYPANLDITVRDADKNKLAYLFFANNSVHALKKLGVFGLVIDIDGQPVDIKFTFAQYGCGSLDLADLGHERFVQDTLVSKFNFQMIRPIILPLISPELRSQSYQLDKHPYIVNYTIKPVAKGIVQFQHNLYQLDAETGDEHLLERIYFNANSLETLREAMYAGKYFHKEDGAFKLVFYPAMGQTEPPK